MANRPTIPQKTKEAVLTKCKRRCCLCFGLNGDTKIKKGQIAHVDGERDNNREGNLAFLCLDHHNEYDSSTSQTIGIKDFEVKRYRRELHKFIKRRMNTEVVGIKLDRDIDSFSNDEQSLFLNAIRAKVQYDGEITVVSKERGCVFIKLELSEAHARELIRLFEQGKLSDQDVISAYILGYGDTESGLGLSPVISDDESNPEFISRGGDGASFDNWRKLDSGIVFWRRRMSFVVLCLISLYYASTVLNELVGGPRSFITVLVVILISIGVTRLRDRFGESTIVRNAILIAVLLIILCYLMLT